MLEIKDLHASINGKEILKGIDLEVKAGEVHAIMGPNGSGKSTLSNVLVGNPAYEVTSGSVTFNGKDLLAMKPEERAHEGLFLSFQQPVEIPGVSMVNFMRVAINAKRKYHGMEPMSARSERSWNWTASWPTVPSTKGSAAGRRSVMRYSRWPCSNPS